MHSINSFPLASLPVEAEQLRPKVRAFLRKMLPTLYPPNGSPVRTWFHYNREFTQALGRQGWIGTTFPTEYGGGGLDVYARYVIAEELLTHSAPVSLHWVTDRQSGPLILRYGTEQQKRKYIPGICRGEITFCIGMSEPNSGSDLASVKTAAVQMPSGWQLNGQKIWTSFAHVSNYMIALVRTSGSAQDRKSGLSQLIVDLSLPGVTVRPILDMAGDTHFCEVFFDNVNLERDALLGQEGAGWKQVNSELALERSGPDRLYSSIALLENWLAFIRTDSGYTQASKRLAGSIIAQLAPLRAMSLSLTQRVAAGEDPLAEAAILKDLGTTLEQNIPRVIADDLYKRDMQNVPPDLFTILAHTQDAAPCFSIRGGTREILRNMIARTMIG